MILKMDRDEIMGLLNAKNEPFAEEVYDMFLDDKFKKKKVHPCKKDELKMGKCRYFSSI